MQKKFTLFVVPVMVLVLVALAYGFIDNGWQNNGNFNATTFNNVKVYRALLSQTSTNAPTATVLENTLGGTPTYARSVAGQYTITLSSAFTTNKTLFFFSWGTSTGVGGVVKDYDLVYTSTSVLTLTTSWAVDNNPDAPIYGSADDMLTKASIEILVYP